MFGSNSVREPLTVVSVFADFEDEEVVVRSVPSTPLKCPVRRDPSP